MHEPRAHTPAEARAIFLDHVRELARYWAHLKGKTERERCDGVAFSILAAIDGTSAMPAMTMTVDPHPDDKEYHREQGENWYEPGTAINADVMLHDEFHKR